MIDYLFYYLQAKYRQWGEKDIPKVYALGIISTLQIFNLLTVVVIALSLNVYKIEMLSDVATIMVSIVILLINYFYLFHIRGSKNIIVRFESGKMNLKKLRILALFYVTFTVLSLILAMGFYLYS